MFKILGNDGKEYGPVSVEQIQQWLREGRAGATTRAQREGSGEWGTLGTMPEFAALLAAPAPAGTDAHGMPPVVRWIAWAMFVTATLSALMSLWSFAGVFQAMSRGNYQLGWTVILSWSVALLALPVRVVIGVGLMRGREWARVAGIYFSVVMFLMGGWGLSRTVWWLMRMEALSSVMYSPMFVLSTLFSLALFLFNIAVVIVLTRPVVRAAFQARSKGV
jgi:hypothetical protein